MNTSYMPASAVANMKTAKMMMNFIVFVDESVDAADEFSVAACCYHAATPAGVNLIDWPAMCEIRLATNMRVAGPRGGGTEASP